MHQFQTPTELHRLRLAAVLLCFKHLMAPAAAGVLIYASLTYDHDLVMIGIALLMLTILIALLQWLIAARTRCPLCMTPVLATKRCAKHRSARTLFMSYRLRVALAILFKNSFRCPYCGEASCLKLRSRRRKSLISP